MPTTLVKGKITLENEYKVCEEGEELDSRQTRLLKLFGVATADFRVRLVVYVLPSIFFTSLCAYLWVSANIKNSYWNAANQEVTEIGETMDE